MHILQKPPRRRQQTGCPSSHESTGSSRSPRRRQREPARCRRRLPQPTDPVCAALAPLLPNPSLPLSVSPSLALSLPPGRGGRHGAARAAPLARPRRVAGSMASRLELGAAGQQRTTREEEEDVEERRPHHCPVGEEAVGASSATPRPGALRWADAAAAAQRCRRRSAIAP
jgi:hypothetical protein